ncbi:tartrate dehydrogenase [Fusibacter paucivorans]|uniref:D-malate dehydrogenase (decarboxylating) n=1 Tax=Fusibacter paucivorans TaxID=76009 RepID=A0ABS5PJ99_9FIRM|nr:tartrate dehydrogenase [Fusibacter paucivorans]MBS7525134.1 tartrate dehydrogenase [Fusibacter paucivorans]
MKNYRIAVIPGDGIGIEVMREGIKVLESVSQLTGDLQFSFDHYDWSCEYYAKNGVMMPKDGLKRLEAYDAILLGAVGYPGVPDHISLRELLLEIRQGFDQYINLRPIKLLPHVQCPVIGQTPETVDMVFIRENTEGEYAGAGGIFRETSPEACAVQSSIFTRRTTEKVMRYAFELARKRGKYHKLTSVTKSNALNYSMVFWDHIFDELASEYADVQTEQCHVDAMAMYMIQRPQDFDVVVASNLFGDILTDLGAALQGGLGFAAGANINPERKYPSMFEPVHGSAPQIAGRGIANPMAMIWTVKMMLDFLGHESYGECVLSAMMKVLADPNAITPDLGGKGTTASVGDAICRQLHML